jgi:hypothetical protein
MTATRNSIRQRGRKSTTLCLECRITLCAALMLIGADERLGEHLGWQRRARAGKGHGEGVAKAGIAQPMPDRIARPDAGVAEAIGVRGQKRSRFPDVV